MGTASSIPSKSDKASKKVLVTRLERERERKYETCLESEEMAAKQLLEYEAKLSELKSKNEQLEETMTKLRAQMKSEADSWQREKSETLHMMFSELPLMHLSEKSRRQTKISTNMFSGSAESLCKTFPMVTIATWDVVGFAELCARITPAEVISLLDKLYARVDDTFVDCNIVILDRSSDSCTAVTGLVEHYYSPSQITSKPPLKKADSTYGSVDDLSSQMGVVRMQQVDDTQSHELPENYAALLASSCLRLMSSIAAIKVSGLHDFMLQLRIALHSGPCSAGAIGLHSEHHIPKYRLFGPTVTRAHWLRSSGLALQIRVSKESEVLLEKKGGFRLERCPDYKLANWNETVESYWLVGMDAHDVRLPSLDRAIPLTNYLLQHV